MKKIISILAAALVCSTAMFAQDAKSSDKKAPKNEGREKMRAEQVAFITSELGLTEAEAQKFWPVYNEVQAQRREAYGKTFQAMKTLREAVENGTDTKAPLDAYLKAKKAAEAIEYEAPAKFQKVLPADKVAKLVLSEERFRHQQIGKLVNGGNRPGATPKQGDRPQRSGPRKSNNK